MSAVLYNDGRELFKKKLSTSAKHNAEYKLHLGLETTESMFDQ
jgi:hypothetical protein